MRCSNPGGRWSGHRSAVWPALTALALCQSAMGGRRSRHRWAVWPALAALALCQPALGGRSDERPIDLSLKFKVGEMSRYHLSVQVEASVPALGPQGSASVYNVRMDLVEQEKVLRSLPHGGGELAISTVSGQGTSNGTAFTTAPTKQPARIGYSAQGDLVSAVGLPASSAGMPMLSNMFGSGALSLNGVFLPNHAINIGDKWNKRVKIIGLAGDSMATVSATYVKNVEVGRYQTAQIHAVLTAPLHTTIDATGQAALRPSTAVGEMTGNFNMVYDTDVAIVEGKVVRAAGNGGATVLIQPWAASGSPTPPLHKAAQGATGKPTHAGKAGGGPPAAHSDAAPTKMVMKLRMGNVLMQ